MFFFSADRNDGKVTRAEIGSADQKTHLSQDPERVRWRWQRRGNKESKETETTGFRQILKYWLSNWVAYISILLYIRALSTGWRNIHLHV